MSIAKGDNPDAQRQIENRNKLHLDPNERADRVNTFIFMALGLDRIEDLIAHPLYWDIVCFCQEFLNAFALGSGDRDYIMLARTMNSFIYGTHYSIPDDSPQLGPNRREHDNIWAERIEAF
jgi:hypothetical protein